MKNIKEQLQWQQTLIYLGHFVTNRKHLQSKIEPCNQRSSINKDNCFIIILFKLQTLTMIKYAFFHHNFLKKTISPFPYKSKAINAYIESIFSLPIAFQKCNIAGFTFQLSFPGIIEMFSPSCFKIATFLSNFF